MTARRMSYADDLRPRPGAICRACASRFPVPPPPRALFLRRRQRLSALPSATDLIPPQRRPFRRNPYPARRLISVPAAATRQPCIRPQGAGAGPQPMYAARGLSQPGPDTGEENIDPPTDPGATLLSAAASRAYERARRPQLARPPQGPVRGRTSQPPPPPLAVPATAARAAAAAARSGDYSDDRRDSNLQPQRTLRLPDRLGAGHMVREHHAAAGTAPVRRPGRPDQADLGLFVPRDERATGRARSPNMRSAVRSTSRRSRSRRTQDHREGRLARAPRNRASCATFTLGLPHCTTCSRRVRTRHYDHVHVDLTRRASGREI